MLTACDFWFAVTNPSEGPDLNVTEAPSSVPINDIPSGALPQKSVLNGGTMFTEPLKGPALQFMEMSSSVPISYITIDAFYASTSMQLQLDSRTRSLFHVSIMKCLYKWYFISCTCDFDQWLPTLLKARVLNLYKGHKVSLSVIFEWMPPQDVGLWVSGFM